MGIIMFILDYNECRYETHKCEGTCINTAGSYACDCADGYRLNTGDSRSCDGMYNKIISYLINKLIFVLPSVTETVQNIIL